jgi:hypothetical protein
VAKPQSGEAVLQPLNVADVSVDMAVDGLVAPNSTVHTREFVTSPAVLSIKELLKKYQMLPTLADFSDALPTTIKSFDIAKIFAATTPAAPSNNPPCDAGLLSYFSAMYRQFHGPLRFKLIPDVQSQHYVLTSVFFTPPNTENDNDDNTNATTIYQTTDYAVANSALPSTFRPAMRLPASLAVYPQKILEFEVPYTSIYESTILVKTSIDKFAYYLEEKLGEIIIAYSSSSNVQEQLFYYMYMAFGDETRFGTLFCVPQLVPVAVNTTTGTLNLFPDDFRSPTVPLNTLVRL